MIEECPNACREYIDDVWWANLVGLIVVCAVLVVIVARGIWQCRADLNAHHDRYMMMRWRQLVLRNALFRQVFGPEPTAREGIR